MRVEHQPVPNHGHYVFFLISIRRLTQYNLGSPTGLPAAERARQSHAQPPKGCVGWACHALGTLEGAPGVQIRITLTVNGLLLPGVGPWRDVGIRQGGVEPLQELTCCAHNSATHSCPRWRPAAVGTYLEWHASSSRSHVETTILGQTRRTIRCAACLPLQPWASKPAVRAETAGCLTPTPYEDGAAHPSLPGSRSADGHRRAAARHARGNQIVLGSRTDGTYGSVLSFSH